MGKNHINRMWYGKNNWEMLNKETWKTGTDRDKMEKLIKYDMDVQDNKSIFCKEKNFLM